MTRASRMFARRRWAFALVATLLTLGGGVGLALLLVAQETGRADGLAAEADLRGSAVTVLATNVRELRAQLQQEGKTPVAPDPTEAVEHLPDRAQVPVPIPGPRGATGADGTKGDKGEKGDKAPVITPLPGQDGKDGADSTVPGPAVTGAAGQDGQDGKDGSDGADGTNGTDGNTGPPPAGWSYADGTGATYTCSLDADHDPAAPHYTCRPDAPAPDPEPDPSPSGTLGLAGLALSATYRRL